MDNMLEENTEQNKEGNKYLWIGGAIFALVLVVALVAKSGKQNTSSKVLPTPTQGVTIGSQELNSQEGQTNMTKDEFKIEDIIVGTGVEAETGKKVTVNYEGTLTNGTKFDSSYDSGEPFTFDLGAGDVIQGWDLGVAGMKVGGKRKLTIPSELAYGARALPGIPANSTLVFTVELLKVE